MFHTQYQNGEWIVLQGNLIVWARCPSERHAKCVAEAKESNESLIVDTLVSELRAEVDLLKASFAEAIKERDALKSIAHEEIEALRFDPELSADGAWTFVKMKEHKHGDWVKYEDYAALLVKPIDAVSALK